MAPKISAHQDRLLAGVFLQVVAAFACAGIGIALDPVVRRHDPGVALGAAAFRVIEATLYVVGAIGTLMPLKLAQEYASAAGPASRYFQTTGALLHSLRDRAVTDHISRPVGSKRAAAISVSSIGAGARPGCEATPTATTPPSGSTTRASRRDPPGRQRESG